MNIVVVIIDTLRYDHVSVNSQGGISTPNLDRLAAKSWNFHRAFSASYATIPQRTDTITGRYGAPFNPWRCLDPDLPSIPRVLAMQGYVSQLIHDTPHLVNGGHGFDFPFDAWTPIRGAEVDRAWITDSWEPMENWTRDPLFDLGPDDLSMEDVIRSCHPITGYVHTNRNRRREEDWNAAQLFRTAARFLEDNAERDNFLLWVDCFDPHEPWDVPPEFVRMYDTTPGYDGRIDPRSFHVRNDPRLSDNARARVEAAYKGKVSFMDKWLGVFLDALETTGLDERTAIVLTADHGTNIGDQPGQSAPYFGKQWPRENELHVPLMISVPGAGQGESYMLVQPQDIFATVLGLAGNGAALPEGIESFDVLASLDAGGEGPRSMAVGGMASAVERWGERGRDEPLFSAFDHNWYLGVTADPAASELMRLGTQENVADDYPDVVARLRTAAIAEIAHRGLDPKLVAWLSSDGQTPFPEAFYATDAKPEPKGWHAGYWLNLYRAMGLPE